MLLILAVKTSVNTLSGAFIQPRPTRMRNPPPAPLL